MTITVTSADHVLRTVAPRAFVEIQALIAEVPLQEVRGDSVCEAKGDQEGLRRLAQVLRDAGFFTAVTPTAKGACSCGCTWQ